MQPPMECQRQNHILCLIAEKDGKLSVMTCVCFSPALVNIVKGAWLKSNFLSAVKLIHG
ncbi:hypothetical protein C7420_102175 [Pantoea ananatis]|nr:hypothetical protein [Pantoea ananatis]PWW12279.1 hypothetical protein DFO57_10843 [Pantoea sp. AG702]MDR6088689.1 hypothetical protein [Pantoea ananatis]PVY85905.1 hypothetical protein C7427_103458 [Pantoea ananatis]PWV69269.1 hypothetical protein C7425_101180 [Pantoea ananatis]